MMVSWDSVWMVRESQVTVVSMVEFGQGAERMLIGGGVSKKRTKASLGRVEAVVEVEIISTGAMG